MSRTPDPTFAIASEDPELLEEVVRYLENFPRWQFEGAARTYEELIRYLELPAPEFIFVSDALANRLAESPAAPAASGRLVVLGRKADPHTLKSALRLRARGFVEWPGDKGEIGTLIEGGATSSPRVQVGEATVVWAPKGGSGASVVAAHLAGSVARYSPDTWLVDLDIAHGDQTTLLGLDAEPSGILDLLRLVEEISVATLESVSRRHLAGFNAVLSPASVGEAGLAKPADLARMIGRLREMVRHVIVDTPGGLSETSVALSEVSNRTIIVTTPDVLSLRRCRTAVQSLKAAGSDLSGVEIVLNRFQSSAGIAESDVEAVLGRPVAATVRDYFAVRKSVGKGKLSGPVLRRLDPLARRIAGAPEGRGGFRGR